MSVAFITATRRVQEIPQLPQGGPVGRNRRAGRAEVLVFSSACVYPAIPAVRVAERGGVPGDVSAHCPSFRGARAMGVGKSLAVA